jgi:hypothetical protein
MDVERQNMEASMKEKRSLVFYNELKNNWRRNSIYRHALKRLEGVQDGGKWVFGN